MAGTIKFFTSSNAGAPSLTGQSGSLISVLDACLVNGFGSLAVSSLEVAGGVATLTYASAHGYEVDQVVTVAGSTVTGGTPGALNGQKNIASVPSATAITFSAAGVADQSASGTITAPLAGAGWDKVFAGTNKAAYRSANPASKGCLLRVADDGAEPRQARVVGYEAMSSVDVGTGQFPTSGQQSGGGLIWEKSSTANATAREWAVFADDRFFYFMAAANVAVGTAGWGGVLVGFGDFVEFNSTDAYSVLITGGATSDIGANNVTPPSLAYSLGGPAAAMTTARYCPRAYTQLGTSIAADLYAPMSVGNSAAYSGYTGLATSFPYPNAPDNGILLCPSYVVHGSANLHGLRGALPGLYWSPQSLLSAHPSSRTRYDATLSPIAGRSLLALRHGHNTSIAHGVAFLDLDGPWR